MTFGSGANGCLGHGDNVDVAQVNYAFIYSDTIVVPAGVRGPGVYNSILLKSSATYCSDSMHTARLTHVPTLYALYTLHSCKHAC